MYTVMVVLDAILALVLIGLVLLQQGKGAVAGAAFGSGASGTVFGAAGGASVIQKVTAWIAAIFFVITLVLSIMVKHRVESAVQQQSQPSSVVQEAASEEAATSAGFVPAADSTTDNDSSPAEAETMVIPEDVEPTETTVQPPTTSAQGEEPASDAPVIPE